ncbi:hypothetical protein SAMN05660662_0950 [Blastococcus aurantiacus]|uniref:ScyD/ScyE family protein n=1 Tax=Blastococcus aurantiacus TaxID=1550231 RepID=A0A1G7I1C1_9ACTN|nr:ScyD/ScyE family protein [Blastococcus aurantiacus]SDF06541.1 hypothetical protein SAMN05660662_0950 [Blastococcus aurantiacus]
MRNIRKAAVATAVMALVMVSPAVASADDKRRHGGGPPVSTVAGGLGGPRQLSDYEGHRLVVAESESGEVSSVDLHNGRVRTLLTGLGNAQGVDAANGRLYVAVGEEMGPPTGGPRTALVEAKPNGHVVRSFDLLQYELAHNPDGQSQDVGEEADTLSNPFAVLAQRNRVLVSDAGANAVLAVDLRRGKVSTFFVPPTVTDTPECRTAPNNGGTFGCDSVPTEITEGPGGLIYVGTLGSEAPGAARVYVLTPSGKVIHVIKGLTGITGVAVDHRGTVYASNVFAGMPEGGPGPGLDPRTIGEVTRIPVWGPRSTAKVTMPTGLEFENGKLYASAWSVAGFLGMPGRGEVQRIEDRAFSVLPR